MTNEAQRNEDTVEPLVRLGLLLIAWTLMLAGWWVDWSGFAQGCGTGMCIVLAVGSGFALARLLKPNPKVSRDGGKEDA